MRPISVRRLKIVFVWLMLVSCVGTRASTEPTAGPVSTSPSEYLATTTLAEETVYATGITFSTLPVVQAEACNSATEELIMEPGYASCLLMVERLGQDGDSAGLVAWRACPPRFTVDRLGGYEGEAGHNLRLSPDGHWIVAFSSWNPLQEPPPDGILLLAADLSQVVSIPRHDSWDAILRWWDGTRWVVLPRSGRISEIQLFDPFANTAEDLPGLGNAVDREYGRTFWSPWRERGGEVVYFNHRFTQLIYFDATTLQPTLAGISSITPLWSLGQGPSAVSAEGFAQWSADDRYAAFVVRLRPRDTEQELVTLDSAGSATVVSDIMSRDPSVVGLDLASSDAWSVDGHLLAFLARSERDDGLYYRDLYVLDLERNEIRQLCAHPEGLVVWWSPDGEYLAYSDPGTTQGDGIAIVTVADVMTGSRLQVGPESDWHILGWVPAPQQE